MEGFFPKTNERCDSQTGGVAEEVLGYVGETRAGTNGERGGLESARNVENESGTRTASPGEINRRRQRRRCNCFLAKGN